MRILIVEDDSIVARFYKLKLGNEGFSTEVVHSLHEAQTAIRQQQPDILLLDRVLPDGDGGDFCKRIKDDPTTAPIFVILLSGLKTGETDQISGLDIGVQTIVLSTIVFHLL